MLFLEEYFQSPAQSLQVPHCFSVGQSWGGSRAAGRGQFGGEGHCWEGWARGEWLQSWGTVLARPVWL